MPMTPLPNWIQTYEPRVKDYYDAEAAAPGQDPAKLWQKWVNDAAQGIEVPPPYASKGETKQSAFAPVFFPNPGTPIQVAIILASAWKAWYMAIQWPTPAPAPPFSVIQSVSFSPVGVPLAYASLLSGLIAEFAVIPPDPLTAFALKATSLGTLFYTATAAAGVQLTGMSLSVPPAPLVIPMYPTL